MTTGWARSTVRRGARPPMQHWFHEEDEESACADSSRRVCFGNDPWPGLQHVCAICLAHFQSWRGLDLPQQRREQR
jgi:hypothetical protein